MDLEQLIANLRRQLADCEAERAKALKEGVRDRRSVASDQCLAWQSLASF